MLSLDRVKSYYDKFGRKQDSQAFYEDPATNKLIEHGRFEQARSVFEFGTGTGRFAEKLLSAHLPSNATYSGIDISETMVSLARDRLRKYSARAAVTLAGGSSTIPVAANSYDRFVCNYVLDLLSESDAVRVLAQAHRILRLGGLLCLASLTAGRTLGTRMVSTLWKAVYRINSALVGGCRPIHTAPLVSPETGWVTEFHTTLSAFAITSEVLLARKAV